MPDNHDNLFQNAQLAEHNDEAQNWPLANLAFLIESSPDLIVIVDRQYQILHLNRTVERMLGYKKTELLGRTLQSLFEDDEPLLQEMQTTDGVVGPFRFRRKDESTCYVEFTVHFAPWRGAPTLAFTFRDVSQRHKMEEEQERLIEELQAALSKVKLLSGLLPMCASCKRIRDFQGYWEAVEAYISEHSEAEFTHSICPECRDKLYPELSHSHEKKNKLIAEE